MLLERTTMTNWLRNSPVGFVLVLALSALCISARGDETAPQAATEEAFTVVLLPDTQLYSQKYPESYVAQAMWIRQRMQGDNIKFVIGLGDIVQHAAIEAEWQNADVAAKILDGVVPYSIVPGNHDLASKDKKLTRDKPLYRKYFPPARYAQQPWYGGHRDEGNDNNYCYFEGAGRKFLVVSLEYAPSDEALAWASQILEQHPQHNAIVATHSYLNLKGRSPSGAIIGGLPGNSGEQMWEKLIRKHANIFMVACGHVGGVRFQTSTNEFDRPVIELLTDYQHLKNGGDGWLRTLKFVPAENKIYVSAYSPLLHEHNLDPQHTHTIDLDFAKLQVAK
jgi:hypothetical protein